MPRNTGSARKDKSEKVIDQSALPPLDEEEEEDLTASRASQDVARARRRIKQVGMDPKETPNSVINAIIEAESPGGDLSKTAKGGVINPQSDASIGVVRDLIQAEQERKATEAEAAQPTPSPPPAQLPTPTPTPVPQVQAAPPVPAQIPETAAVDQFAPAQPGPLAPPPTPTPVQQGAESPQRAPLIPTGLPPGPVETGPGGSATSQATAVAPEAAQVAPAQPVQPQAQQPVVPQEDQTRQSLLALLTGRQGGLIEDVGTGEIQLSRGLGRSADDFIQDARGLSDQQVQSFLGGAGPSSAGPEGLTLSPESAQSAFGSAAGVSRSPALSNFADMTAEPQNATEFAIAQNATLSARAQSNDMRLQQSQADDAVRVNQRRTIDLTSQSRNLDQQIKNAKRLGKQSFPGESTTPRERDIVRSNLKSQIFNWKRQKGILEAELQSNKRHRTGLQADSRRMRDFNAGIPESVTNEAAAQALALATHRESNAPKSSKDKGPETLSLANRVSEGNKDFGRVVSQSAKLGLSLDKQLIVTDMPSGKVRVTNSKGQELMLIKPNGGMEITDRDMWAEVEDVMKTSMFNVSNSRRDLNAIIESQEAGDQVTREAVQTTYSDTIEKTISALRSDEAGGFSRQEAIEELQRRGFDLNG